MNYTFDKMTGNKKLYEKMWEGTEFCSDDFISNKNWTGNTTSASFYIKTPKTTMCSEDVLNDLADDLGSAFDLTNKELFNGKLRQACSGSGQEVLKITTMHSSSLCALLFFYNVSQENELVLNLGNDTFKKTYVFNQSFFEFQNVVIKGRQPSNMDVVLIGYEKEDESKQVVLFLESKFSEYYAEPKAKLDIADSYLKNQYGGIIYKKLQKIGYNVDVTIAPANKFRLLAPVAAYMDGIKQMISHYIGVRNLLTGEVVKKRAREEHKDVVKTTENNATVLLGSIIFDDLFDDIKDKKKYYGAYEEAHVKLVKVLNEVSKGVDAVAGTDRLTVLEIPLTYTEIFDKEKIGCAEKGFELDKKVKDYYFGKNQETNSVTPV